jgi:hypothetical protein
MDASHFKNRVKQRIASILIQIHSHISLHYTIEYITIIVSALQLLGYTICHQCTGSTLYIYYIVSYTSKILQIDLQTSLQMSRALIAQYAACAAILAQLVYLLMISNNEKLKFLFIQFAYVTTTILLLPLLSISISRF